MPSIPKVFHTLEHREMTIQEYEHYISEHPQWCNIKAIICVECGDEIIYCNGLHNTSFFKHIPTHEGHSYCSFYHEGQESKTCEALFRKKLFRDKDISLNFEIRYFGDIWTSLITIPPLKKEEIKSNQQNDSLLSVSTSYRGSLSLPIDEGHFSSGEIKRISLEGFPNSARISITGNGNSHNISYDFECFRPDFQIYSNLILQEYFSETTGDHSLKNIKSFACKRVSGKVYLGKHYLVFAYENCFNLSESEATVRRIIFNKQLNADYQVYYAFDIVFHRLTNSTEKFCSSRNCTLVEKNNAVIIWPPVNSVGNYKYYKKDKTNMFMAFENNSRVIDLYSHSTDMLWFKINNDNVDSFYVTQQTKKPEQKSASSIVYLESNNATDDSGKNYLFENGVLKKRVDSIASLKPKQEVIVIQDRLNRMVYSAPQRQTPVLDQNELLNITRYSRPYSQLTDNEYLILYKKYKENQLIVEYLGMCLRQKKIKKLAKRWLMEEGL
ncbi:MAG TPA: hypothetical protein PKC96_01600 [Bacilli bacterium]|nr:hypothetical protein [Bacilli bacterium]